MNTAIAEISDLQLEIDSVLSCNKIFDINKYANQTTRHRLSHPTINQYYFTSGSEYKGIQRSERKDYEVKVQIKFADLSQPYVCGYLTIYNLIEESASLSTFFEAEIIGRNGPFLTSKWDTTAEIDQKHWSKFPEFFPYQSAFTSNEAFDYGRLIQNDECIFMRWKEIFMVPDHRILSVEGASFAGFYYICCKPKKGMIDGYYFHRNSDMYQQLLLSYIAPKACPEQEIN